MPDIDVDFCFERRQEVIDYVVRKYGKDQVVQIVTFGTLAARGVIRDVGRVMDLPYAMCGCHRENGPQRAEYHARQGAEGQSGVCRSSMNSDEEVKNLIDMAKRLEGLPRHTSMHAAGVVISQKAVDEYVPLSRAARRYDHHPVYHDDSGGAGTSENGFPGTSYPDGHPECREGRSSEKPA